MNFRITLCLVFSLLSSLIVYLLFISIFNVFYVVSCCLSCVVMATDENAREPGLIIIVFNVLKGGETPLKPPQPCTYNGDFDIILVPDNCGGLAPWASIFLKAADGDSSVHNAFGMEST